MHQSGSRIVNGCRSLTLKEKAQLGEFFAGESRLRNAALFVLGIKSGFRISELLSLRVGDIYHKGAMLEEVRVERQNMKGKRFSRVVPLHPEASKVLYAWLSFRQFPSPDAFVFSSRQGGNRPLSRVQAWRILKDAFQACQIAGKLATHTLRKTYAADMYEALGHDLEALRVSLGHADIRTTIRYLAASKNKIWEAHRHI